MATPVCRFYKSAAGFDEIRVEVFEDLIRVTFYGPYFKTNTKFERNFDKSFLPERDVIIMKLVLTDTLTQQIVLNMGFRNA